MANRDPLFDITGKTAIVTGASSGLGEVFSNIFAERGANLVLAARRTERLEDVAEKIIQGGGKSIAVSCDVGDAAQVKQMVAIAAEHFGRVDILVNNAGQVADGGPVPERLPDELFEQTVRVNLLGTWYCCREVGERMLRDGKGGSIINIASIMGLGGQQNHGPAYLSTKAAVINLTSTLACSWGDRGVRVNAIAPGWFPSEMTEPFFAAPAFFERIKGQSPMGRVGDPSELAGALLLLASNASSFMTGHTLLVDGGLSASIGAPPFSEEIFAEFASAVPDGLGERIMPS